MDQNIKQPDPARHQSPETISFRLKIKPKSPRSRRCVFVVEDAEKIIESAEIRFIKNAEG